MVEPSRNGSNGTVCRIGVYVCQCGTNIGGVIDVEAVAAHARQLPDVVVARTYSYMCSDPGQALIKQDIEDHQLDRVVVASCSPLMHESTFRSACAEAGCGAGSSERRASNARSVKISTSRAERGSSHV